MRNRLAVVLMSSGVLDNFLNNPAGADVKKSEDDVRRMWDRLFKTAEDFLNGNLGKIDESLRSNIEKLMEFKDRNPLEKDSVNELSDFLKGIFDAGLEELNNEEEKK